MRDYVVTGSKAKVRDKEHWYSILRHLPCDEARVMEQQNTAENEGDMLAL